MKKVSYFSCEYFLKQNQWEDLQNVTKLFVKTKETIFQTIPLKFKLQGQTLLMDLFSWW